MPVEFSVNFLNKKLREENPKIENAICPKDRDTIGNLINYVTSSLINPDTSPLICKAYRLDTEEGKVWQHDLNQLVDGEHILIECGG